MPKPPETGPHSDIEGVNRDARAGQASPSQHPEPGSAIQGAKEGSAGRPDETPPEE